MRASLPLRAGWVALVIIAGLAYWVAHRVNERPAQFALVAEFPVVLHLNPGAPVKVLGVLAGRVDKVAVVPERAANGSGAFVRLSLSIDKQYASYLGKDATAIFAQASPLGEPYVSLEAGHPASPRLGQGEAVKGQVPITGRILSKAAEALRADVGPLGAHMREGKTLVTERIPPWLDEIKELSRGVQGDVSTLQVKLRDAREQVDDLAALDWTPAVALWSQTRFYLNRAMGRLRHTGQVARERLQDTTDDVRHTFGVFRAAVRTSVGALADELPTLPPLATQVGQVVRRAVLDRRYTLAAFIHDDEVQNDVKGFQMTLKRKFWRFLFVSDGCPPAP